jgi:hypothetical protein
MGMYLIRGAGMGGDGGHDAPRARDEADEGALRRELEVLASLGLVECREGTGADARIALTRRGRRVARGGPGGAA